MRELQVVDVGDPRALWEPLSRALFDGGPAVLPRPGGAKLSHTAPREVSDDVALVVETSGTTGAPKRVALSARAVLSSAQMANDELARPGTWLLALPSYYIAGIQVFVRAHLGGTVPVMVHPDSFSSTALLARSQELLEAATHGGLFTSLVPTQLQRILDDAGARPQLHELMRGFDRILVGGQALPEVLATRALDAGYRITRTYGSSETAGGCVWDGSALPGVDVSEIDGRIALAGSMLAQGYVDDSERTEKNFRVLEGQRWYLSDDRGEIDTHGRLHLRGRIDDMIISGGLKVSLGEIERVIHSATEATDGVVVAVPHEKWGHVPVLVTTHSLDLSAVRALLGSAIGSQARIERIVRRDVVPLLDSGKPDRLAIAAMAKGGGYV
jgi:O-succinylbenzoic acid--CoA ligase